MPEAPADGPRLGCRSACHTLFARLLQALIELATARSEERALLDSLSNHIAARVGLAASRRAAPGLETPT